MNRSYLFAGTLAFAAVAWIASGQFKEDEAPSVEEMTTATGTAAKATIPQVRVRHSTARRHQNSLVMFGRTEGVRMVRIKVETAGRIATVSAQKGRTVKKGEVIARIVMADREARLKKAEALVNRYDIAFQAARKLSKKQYRSKVQLAEAISNLETAKAQLRSIAVDIDRTAIRAPFDGFLDDIPVEVGDYVAIGEVAATVVDLDPILVVGEVTERVASLVSVGDKARVSPVGSAPLDGVIRYMSKIGSPSTRTFRVEVSLANPGAVLAEGLTAEMRLDLGSILAHFLSPAVLTLNDAGELGVKAVDADDVVRFHRVGIVDDTPQGIWLTGLPDEVQLIVVGQEFVRPGQKVLGVEGTAGKAAS